jgi:hypothetical protein
MGKYYIVYNVKFCEPFAADMCEWMECAGDSEGNTPRQAQKAFKDMLRATYGNLMIGRHISTRELTSSEQ